MLRSVINECQQKYYLTTPSLLNSEDEQHKQATTTELMPIHYFNKFVRSHGIATELFSTTTQSETVSQQAGSLQGANEIISRFQKWSWIASSGHSLQNMDLDGQSEKAKQKAGASSEAAMSLWTRYRQLEHCSWWSLSYTFGKGDFRSHSRFFFNTILLTFPLTSFGHHYRCYGGIFIGFLSHPKKKRKRRE